MALYMNGVNIGGGRHAAVNTSRSAWAGARKVMPLGDSITAGAVGSTDLSGYRNQLFLKSARLGKPLEFVGTDGPSGPAATIGFQFPGAHNGRSGYKATDWWNGSAGPIDAALSTAAPDYVCLHIGTNSMNSTDAAGAPAALAALLDRIHAQRSGALVYLAKIIPSSDDTVDTNFHQPYNASMDAIQAARSGWVTIVDMHAAFTAHAGYQTDYYPVGDSVHPNDAGYVVMGDTWSAAVQ